MKHSNIHMKARSNQIIWCVNNILFHRQEKADMAEIAREQKRQEQKEKARKAEMKAYDVKRKKMALEAHAEALRKQQ